MLAAAVISLAVALQEPAVQSPGVRDSAASVQAGVSVGTRRRDGREREAKRVPVTPQHLATAFRTPLARDILERARAARLAQDSALTSYDAMAHLRISAGLGFSRIGRDRLIFRHENATHVRWSRAVGAWIDVKGARTAIPIIPREEEEEESRESLGDDDFFPVPYYPGQEPLMSFNGSGMVKSQVDERDMVHPLAGGAEAYYTYAVGDSVIFRLPDGRTIGLLELRVRPREPKWNVAVGSLWFDRASGQLVRAAYRLAVPMDVWAQVKEEEPDADEDIPLWVKPLIMPMRAQVTAIAVEYGLYQGRFWLPRLRSAEGDAQVSFARLPFRFDQSFRYNSVNATDSLPAIRPTSFPEPPDSLSDREVERWRDSVREVRREERRARVDSVRRGLRPAFECDADGLRTSQQRRQQSGMNVAVRIPCDLSVLETSPELPKSIFDDGEEIFGSADRDALVKEALGMGAQPPFAIGAVPPALHWGLQFTRFNRVEGLSTGALVEQKLGSGYTATLFARIGHADLRPNAEVALARSNLSRTIRLRGYQRLAAANDWGNPLAFGSSLGALLFGGDEGFYYRATGAELEWARDHGSHMSWRLFAEQQRPARQEIARALGAAFIPNIVASRGRYAGASMRLTHSLGLDPEGFRMFTDARVEGAVSDSASASYGRGALDLTFTKGFGRFASALTLSSGSSVGVLPIQRHWFLGSAHTVRGQRADPARSGNSYWLGRLEIGAPVRAVRPLVFADVGWAGDRAEWRSANRPMSGAGAGFSALDGLFRFDVARGIHPDRRTRMYLYLDAKF